MVCYKIIVVLYNLLLWDHTVKDQKVRFQRVFLTLQVQKIEMNLLQTKQSD